MTTGTAPTAIDVERYIELDALWTIVLNLFVNGDLLPVLEELDVDLIASKGSEEVSRRDLFTLIVPEEDVAATITTSRVYDCGLIREPFAKGGLSHRGVLSEPATSTTVSIVTGFQQLEGSRSRSASPM